MHLMRTRSVWIVTAAALLLAACSSAPKAPEEPPKDYSRQLPPGTKALELVTNPAEYPDFDEMFGDREATLQAIENSLAWFAKPSSHTWYPFDDITHERCVRSLEALREVLETVESPQELNGYMHLYFDVYRSVGWDGNGGVLFTAYCQPIFQGSRERTSTFRYPLYGLPGDLVKAEDGTPLGRQDGERVVPYHTRREIEDGDLLRGTEVVWLASELDAYIVHVQGSAQIELIDGDVMYLGYAGKTDRPYSSLGRALVEAGAIKDEDISLASIRSWFDRHPEQLTDYLQRNESFVFFLETGPGGPWGSLGAPVTAYRTIATDKSIFPRGAPCAVDTRVGTTDGGSRPFVSFALDQDTGGAIRSAGRCDIFVGTGPQAEKIAGHTKYEGRLFYLFVKEGARLGVGP